MTTTYTWSVPAVESEVSTGEITTIHWRVEATDGNNVVSAYGTVPLPADANTSANTFIPYANVTQDLAIQWAQNHLDVGAYEASLDKQLAELAKPATITGTPW